MARHQLYLSIIFMFLLTFTHCLYHQQIDGSKQSNGMNHKHHLKTNQITPMLYHQSTDQYQVQQHNIIYQHNQIATGCTEQQQKKAAQAIDACQIQNITQAGVCMNKEINKDLKQKWNIFIVQKGQLDSGCISLLGNCMVKFNNFGKYERDYFLWPINDQNLSTSQNCTDQKMNGFQSQYQNCQYNADYTDRAQCIFESIRSQTKGEEWNVIISSIYKEFHFFKKNDYQEHSYKKFFSFRKCQHSHTHDQDKTTVEYTVWAAKP